MALRKKKEPDIVIKRRSRSRKKDEESHGGWKVAYADFLTALMAFFLLMWLTEATSERQQAQLSEYFNAGSETDMATESLIDTGIIDISREAGQGDDANSPGTGSWSNSPDRKADGNGGRGSPLDYWDVVELPRAEYDAMQEKLDRAEQMLGEDALDTSDGSRYINRLASRLKEIKRTNPAFRGMDDSIRIERTGIGLRISFIEQDDISMFQVGSTALTPKARQMLSRFGAVLQGIPNRIGITGHTDSRPYGDGTGYSNWDLSTERANAARRILQEAGVAEDQFASVEGKADTQLLMRDSPSDPGNRRIEVSIFR